MQAKNREVVRLALALQDGKIPFLEGVRALNALRSDVTRDDFDPDFLPFVAVYSETDHIPVGALRESCAESWLAKCDDDLERIKKVFAQEIIDACVRLISRFSHDA